MAFPMSDILPIIRKLAEMELEDLGTDESTQNSIICQLTTVVLRKRARQAYLVETSDTLDITSDGYQTFLKNGQPITDMYEPLGIYGPLGYLALKRSSWDAPEGWWREAENQPIHTKRMTGVHYLKYLRYPKPVASQNDTVEFPLAGQWDLIMDVVALCKLPKNFYQEYDAVKKNATGTATIKATINARGSTNWSPPSEKDKEE